MVRLLFCFLAILPSEIFAQNAAEKVDENPRTILWKITGKDCKPSYLLGTFHHIGADWLYQFPEVKVAIDKSEKLLTESISDDSFKPNLNSDNLRALTLLSKDQYATLDSFFVAKVGEGIRNNPDAEEMSVLGMVQAVIMTLFSGPDGKPAVNQFMDFDLFHSYKSKGKPTDVLEHLEQLDLNKSDSVRGKEALASIVKAVRMRNVGQFDITNADSEAGSLFHNYKQMNLNYELTKDDPSDKFIAVKLSLIERNANWIPAIESNIRQNECLIAVGYKHFLYKTGLISLLRKKGYTVEPVSLTIPK